MYIFTTLDDNFPKIWEASGTATFSSTFEDIKIYDSIHDNIASELCAIGIYRASKGKPQNFAPSLLRITDASLVPGAKHDIQIAFIFVKKLSFNVDTRLRTIKKNFSPLIEKIDECFLRGLTELFHTG